MLNGAGASPACEKGAAALPCRDGAQTCDFLPSGAFCLGTCYRNLTGVGKGWSALWWGRRAIGRQQRLHRWAALAFPGQLSVNCPCSQRWLRLAGVVSCGQRSRNPEPPCLSRIGTDPERCDATTVVQRPRCKEAGRVTERSERSSFTALTGTPALVQDGCVVAPLQGITSGSLL